MSPMKGISTPGQSVSNVFAEKNSEKNSDVEIAKDGFSSTSSPEDASFDSDINKIKNIKASEIKSEALSNKMDAFIETGIREGVQVLGDAVGGPAGVFLKANNFRLFLVRHGKTDDNAAYRLQGGQDTLLNEDGMKQAEKAALVLSRYIKDADNVAIYSSDLKRAQQTASCFQKVLKENGKTVPVQLVKDLREYDFGDWNGMTTDDIRHKYGVDKKGNSPFDVWGKSPRKITPPNGEHIDEFFDRVGSALNDIVEKHKSKGQDVVLFTHGGVIKCLLNIVAGKDSGSMNPIPTVSNGGVCLLEYSDGKFIDKGKLHS